VNGLRGQGYQKKGGAQATQLHNEQVRRTAPSLVPAEPTPDAARTRVSAGVSWPLLASAWIAGMGMGGSTAVLVQALMR